MTSAAKQIRTLLRASLTTLVAATLVLGVATSVPGFAAEADANAVVYTSDVVERLGYTRFR